jgi:hypothetical protein
MSFNSLTIYIFCKREKCYTQVIIEPGEINAPKLEGCEQGWKTIDPIEN